MRAFKNITFNCTCNNRCDYCGKPNYKIDTQVVCKYVDKIFDKFGKKEMAYRITPYGEITIYPELLEYLEEKAEEGYVIEVVSNGMTALDSIKDNSMLRWIFSLDGHTVRMNHNRHFSQKTIDNILEAVFKFKAEIQCVYTDQTIEEINEFIKILKENNYSELLSIFSARMKGTKSEYMIDYRNLEPAIFLPPEKYFERWEKNYLYGICDKDCDFNKNGYEYHIADSKLFMLKCSCNNKLGDYIMDYGDEHLGKFECGPCFSHFAFNNSRKILNE